MFLFSRETGPFSSAQKKNEVWKKKVDAAIKEFEKVIKNQKLKDREEKLRNIYGSFTEFHTESVDLKSSFISLTNEKEPKSIRDFDRKKSVEIEKIEQLQTKIAEQKAKFPEEIKASESSASVQSKAPEEGDGTEVGGPDKKEIESKYASDQGKDATQGEDDKKQEKPGKKSGRKNKNKFIVTDEIREEVAADLVNEKTETPSEEVIEGHDNEPLPDFSPLDFSKVDQSEDEETEEESEEENDDDQPKIEEKQKQQNEGTIVHDEEGKGATATTSFEIRPTPSELSKAASSPADIPPLKPVLKNTSRQRIDDASKTQIDPQPQNTHENIRSVSAYNQQPSEKSSIGDSRNDIVSASDKHAVAAETAASTPAKPAGEDGEGKEEESEEDWDDDDEDDQEESEEEPPPQTMLKYITLSDYAGSMPDDLSFSKGEILTVSQSHQSDWWEATNSKGVKGLVPSNFLKHFDSKHPSEVDQASDEDDEESDGEEDYEDTEEESEDENNVIVDAAKVDQIHKVIKPSVATQKLKAAQKVTIDDSEHKEESEEEKTEDHPPLIRTTSGSASEHWDDLRRTVTETSISDVLHALGAVPSGFRPSTLAANIMKDESYRMVHYLTPKLTQSNLAYADLSLDVTKNKIKKHQVRIEKVVRIRTCKKIPAVGAGMEVLCRHVRACLFDGEHILSNIHCVKVSAVTKNQTTWTFNSRITETMDTEQHAEIFLRTNSAAENIGVLFELCVTCIRTSTQEVAEISCGWVHIPLIDDATGQLIVNKSYELQVSGGTPYEDGVEVDPTISRRASSSVIVSMLSGNKQPTLSVRLTNPTPEQKDLMQTLPDSLIGNTSLLMFYSYYRQLLADCLIRDRLDLDSTEGIHNIILANFPSIADAHDIMHIFRTAWVDRQRFVKRSEKDPNTLMRDEEYVKELFCEVFMDTCYPLISLANLPSYHSAYLDSDKHRAQLIAQYRALKQNANSTLAIFCSSEYAFRPFDINEVTYRVVNNHCLPRPIRIESG